MNKLVKPENFGSKDNPVSTPANSVVSKKKDPEEEEFDPNKTLESLEINVVNAEKKVQRVARRLAREKFDKEMEGLSFKKNWKKASKLFGIGTLFKKSFKRNAAEAYLKQYEQEIAANIRQNPKNFHKELQDPILTAPLPEEEHQAELAAMVERISSVEGGRTAAEEASKVEIKNDEINGDIAKLLLDYANSGDKGVFETEKEKVLQKIKQEVQLEDTTMLGDQLEQTAEKVRAHMAGVANIELDNLKKLINLNLYTAEDVDVHTDTRDLTRTSKVANWLTRKLQGTKLGGLVNPVTSAAIIYAGVNFLTSGGTRLAVAAGTGALLAGAAPLIAAGLGAAAVAVMRKNKETTLHKAQKEARDAVSHQPDQENKFETRLSATLYEKKSAKDLSAAIDAACESGDADAILDAIAEAEARRNISLRENLDLIRYQESKIERGRLELVRTIAEAKKDLRASGVQNWEQTLQSKVQNAESNLMSGNIEVKDRQFKELRRSENYKTAIIGGVMGAASAYATGWIRNEFFSGPAPSATPGSAGVSKLIDDPTSNAGKADLTNLLRTKGYTGPIDINSDGSLSKATIDALNDQGFGCSQITTTIPSGPARWELDPAIKNEFYAAFKDNLPAGTNTQAIADQVADNLKQASGSRTLWETIHDTLEQNGIKTGLNGKTAEIKNAIMESILQAKESGFSEAKLIAEDNGFFNWNDSNFLNYFEKETLPNYENYLSGNKDYAGFAKQAASLLKGGVSPAEGTQLEAAFGALPKNVQSELFFDYIHRFGDANSQQNLLRVFFDEIQDTTTVIGKIGITTPDIPGMTPDQADLLGFPIIADWMNHLTHDQREKLKEVIEEEEEAEERVKAPEKEIRQKTRKSLKNWLRGLLPKRKTTPESETDTEDIDEEVEEIVKTKKGPGLWSRFKGFFARTPRAAEPSPQASPDAGGDGSQTEKTPKAKTARKKFNEADKKLGRAIKKKEQAQKRGAKQAEEEAQREIDEAMQGISAVDEDSEEVQKAPAAAKKTPFWKRWGKKGAKKVSTESKDSEAADNKSTAEKIAINAELALEDLNELAERGEYIFHKLPRDLQEQLMELGEESKLNLEELFAAIALISAKAHMSSPKDFSLAEDPTMLVGLFNRVVINWGTLLENGSKVTIFADKRVNPKTLDKLLAEISFSPAEESEASQKRFKGLTQEEWERNYKGRIAILEDDYKAPEVKIAALPDYRQAEVKQALREGKFDEAIQKEVAHAKKRLAELADWFAEETSKPSKQKKAKATKKQSQVPHSPEPKRHNVNTESAAEIIHEMDTYGSKLLFEIDQVTGDDFENLINETITKDPQLSRKLEIVRSIDIHTIINAVAALFAQEHEDLAQDSKKDNSELFAEVIRELKQDSKTLHKILVTLLDGHTLPVAQIRIILGRIDKKASQEQVKKAAKQKGPSIVARIRAIFTSDKRQASSKINVIENRAKIATVDKAGILEQSKQISNEELRLLAREGKKIMEGLPASMKQDISERGQLENYQDDQLYALIALIVGLEGEYSEDLFARILINWQRLKAEGKSVRPLLIGNQDNHSVNKNLLEELLKVSKEVLETNLAENEYLRKKPEQKKKGTEKPGEDASPKKSYEAGREGVDDLQSRFERLVPDANKREQFMNALTTIARELGILPERDELAGGVEAQKQAVLDRALTKWEQIIAKGESIQVFVEGQVQLNAIRKLLSDMAAELGVGGKKEKEEPSVKDKLRKKRQKGQRRDAYERGQRAEALDKKEAKQARRKLEESKARSRKLTAEKLRNSSIDEIIAGLQEEEGAIDAAEIAAIDEAILNPANWDNIKLVNSPIDKQVAGTLGRMIRMYAEILKRRDQMEPEGIARNEKRLSLLEEFRDTGSFVAPTDKKITLQDGNVIKIPKELIDEENKVSIQKLIEWAKENTKSSPGASYLISGIFRTLMQEE